MARKKLKLAFIENDAIRKSTFKKRKKGMIKKLDELTTLCDVDACALIYSPYDLIPEVWPSPLGVQRQLTKFRKMPVMELTRKMDDQESFLRRSIKKTLDQIRKADRDNAETKVKNMMFQCLNGERSLDDLTVNDMKNVSWFVGQTLSEVNNRLEKGLTVGESSLVRTNLISCQMEKPNVVAMMNMTNVQPSNLSQWQHGNFPSHQISNTTRYVNENIQMPYKNFFTDNNDDINNDEKKITVNNDSNIESLWSNGFFPWNDK